MSKGYDPHVPWVVGDGEETGRRRRGWGRVPRSVMPGDRGVGRGRGGDAPLPYTRERRSPRRWVVVDSALRDGPEGGAPSPTDGEASRGGAVGGRPWQVVGHGAGVRRAVEGVDRVAGWRLIAFLLPLLALDAVVSLAASSALVLGHTWAYDVVAGVLILAALPVNVGVAVMVRTPWWGRDLERRIRSAGETPAVLFPVRRLLNSGWGAATDEALWVWNRAHRFLWRRPPTRIHFSAVHGYRVMPRGDGKALLLLVSLPWGVPQVPAVAWDVQGDGEMSLLRLDLAADEAEGVVVALTRYGVEPLPSLGWPSWWGVPPHPRNVVGALAGFVVGEGVFQWLLRGEPPLVLALISLPVVGLVAAGVRRWLHGQSAGAVMTAGGLMALLSLGNLYRADLLVWRLAFPAALLLALVPVVVEAHRGVVGWVPRVFRLLWALWLLFAGILAFLPF